MNISGAIPQGGYGPKLGYETVLESVCVGTELIVELVWVTLDTGAGEGDGIGDEELEGAAGKVEGGTGVCETTIKVSMERIRVTLSENEGMMWGDEQDT